MVIRCERCSTLYELDEALLEPTGSQVQCTRCEHVFMAFPPSAPAPKHAVAAAGGDASALATTPEAAAEATPEATTEATPETTPPQASPVVAEAAAVVAGAAAASAGAAALEDAPAARPRAEARPARSGPAPVYRPTPPASGAASAPRTPMVRRDTIGTFEARLRWSARLRWMVPAAIGIAVVAAVAGWLALSRRGAPDDRAAEARRVERRSPPESPRAAKAAALPPAEVPPAAVPAAAVPAIAEQPAAGAPEAPTAATEVPPAVPPATPSAPPEPAPSPAEAAAPAPSPAPPVNRAPLRRKILSQPPLEPLPVPAVADFGPAAPAESRTVGAAAPGGPGAPAAGATSPATVPSAVPSAVQPVGAGIAPAPPPERQGVAAPVDDVRTGSDGG